MKILVTGAAGFIGYHVSKKFLELGNQVVGIDSLNDYYDPALKLARLSELGVKADLDGSDGPSRGGRYPGFEFFHARLEDRRQIDAIFDASGFDLVVNLAAQAGVRYSIDHPREYVDSNIVGFLNILEGCRNHKVGHLVYASSSSVYGLNDSRPFSTKHGTNHPVSLYAATKKANELMAHAYSNLYSLPTTGLRFFTVYGPWGRPDMAYFKFAKAIMKGAPIDVYNNGDMWRDYTFIDDIVEGVVRVSMKIPAGDSEWDARDPDPSRSVVPYRVFNLGNNRSVKLSEFIGILEDNLGKKARKNYLPMQPGDVYATEADVSALREYCGWSPETDINYGLARFCEWFGKYAETAGIQESK